MLRIKDIDFDVVEINDKNAEAITGGQLTWMCVWPEGEPISSFPFMDVTWHYNDPYTGQWVNTGYSCECPGNISVSDYPSCSWGW